MKIDYYSKIVLTIRGIEMFNIVLVEPQIPPNTGTIGRLCVNLGATLHLVKPLGFDIDDKAVSRAGLDYWKDLDLVVWESFDAFLEAHPIDENSYLATTKTNKLYF
jgi:tRNA (cytidine/uridine-2'-O-)-methyltransferase